MRSAIASLHMSIIKLLTIYAGDASPRSVGSDVVTGLSRACLVRGHQVTVMLPFYSSLPKGRIEGLTFDRNFYVPKARSPKRWMHI